MENQNAVQAQAPQQQMAVTNETIVDSTLRRVGEMQQAGGLQLPKNYSAGNAVRAAWLILQEVENRDKVPALVCCTRESVAYALLNMVIQGLDPMKSQCAFIVYGNKLTLQREYQGTIALAKRRGLKSVVANPIFKGDVFEFEVNTITGRKTIKRHEQSFENYGGEVVGAYAITTMEDGTVDAEVMNMNQIRQAWNQGATKGTSPAHKNFPDQMACKTVIGRALKQIVNSADDADLFAFEDEETTALDHTVANIQYKIETSANRKEIGFVDEETGELHEPVSTDPPVENTQSTPPVAAEAQPVQQAPKRTTPF